MKTFSLALLAGVGGFLLTGVGLWSVRFLYVAWTHAGF